MAAQNPDEIDLFEDDFYNDSNESNESNDHEVAEDAAMAATLGFSSFGGSKPAADDDDDPHPAKKRRFNPHADEAVVAPADPMVPTVTAHKAHARSRGKGRGNRAVANRNERQTRTISRGHSRYVLVDTANPQNNVDRSRYVYADSANPQNNVDYSWTEAPGAGNNDDDFELDTTAGVDHNLEGAGNPKMPKMPKMPEMPEMPEVPKVPKMPEMPKMPPMPSFLQPPGSRAGAGHGPRNPLWYADYYDASSNENPWEGMEKFKGLAPVGTWLARYWDREKKKEGEGSGGDGGDGDGGVAEGTPAEGGQGEETGDVEEGGEEGAEESEEE